MAPENNPVVWLPIEPADLDEHFPGLRLARANPPCDVPDTPEEVQYFVVPYMGGPAAVEIVARMPKLRVVQTLTAGVDDIRPVVPEHVTLCNGAGIHNASTAELALTLILSSLRGVPEFVRHQDAHEWSPIERPALADKRVLICGYGAVGQAIEARLRPFETEVVRVARSAREGVYGFEDLAGLLPTADVVVLSMPLTPETRGMVDTGFLARMRDGALLVNVARGTVVVSDDLVRELRSGRIRAAVDVVDEEPMSPGHVFWDVPNLLITPHVGGASSAMWPRARLLLRQQLRRFSAGEPLKNVVRANY